MKKTLVKNRRKQSTSEMQKEYKFDYVKARRNRFAAKMQRRPLVVIVDPDVAQVFSTPQSVNRALRALISAIPKTGGRKTIDRSSTRR